MGCLLSSNKIDDNKRNISDPDILNSSGPLHIDHELAQFGADAPLIDKLAYTTNAYVVSVYDGDTFTVALRSNFITGDAIGGKIIQSKCRVIGIDTPEMRPPRAQTDRDAEIVCAKIAKQFVEIAILHKHVQLHVAGTDKYGRLLVTVAIPDTGDDLSTILINKKLAYPYDGGTKKAFSEYSQI